MTLGKSENLTRIFTKRRTLKKKNKDKTFWICKKKLWSISKYGNEQAKEEVDVLKEKYDAMKEADNDYLDALSDAIEKQRALRDLEKYDDLQNRKKLFNAERYE